MGEIYSKDKESGVDAFVLFKAKVLGHDKIRKDISKDKDDDFVHRLSEPAKSIAITLDASISASSTLDSKASEGQLNIIKDKKDGDKGDDSESEVQDSVQTPGLNL